ncbi:Retrovirus-related Pol polyprotein [Thelohanellus kitauei]|uniref:Retrovirus-related Pol polyprotein n=1 Tax=Thelohanellus kitauei TaxID=669202 RepID=A0A0C2NJM9_THEKT|nr:Retrovirus-related Pol polyprotein [Thelohanellus kitauei]
MANDIEQYLSDCLSCRRTKYKNYTPRASLSPIIAEERFSFWEVDFIGPLPTTKRGNKFIIMFIDLFSKWVEAEALTDQSADSAAEAFMRCVVSRYGIPKQIHSDKGTQFESTLFQSLCSSLHISKTSTTPYHPMGNGGVERANRSIKEVLRHYVSNQQNDWDDQLPLALLALRAFPHTSTKYSPALLTHGAELNLPIDFISKGGVNANIYNDPQTHIKVKKMQNLLNGIFEQVKVNILKNGEVMKRYYNNKLHERTYAIGEKVLLKVQHPTKLNQQFDGPYEIIKCHHPYYHIKSQMIKGKVKKIHHNLLVPSFKEKFQLANRSTIENPLRRSARIRRPAQPFQYPVETQKKGRGGNVIHTRKRS